MDKASVARVCIMFNYKNIYSLKIFKIMSICCAFSFSLFIFPGLGWDERRPLETQGKLWALPFLAALPFLMLVCLVALGFTP